MAKKDAGFSKVCFRHPERETTLQCPVCLQPICVECIHEHNKVYFCSDLCAQKQADAEARMREIDAKVRKQQARQRMLALLRFAIIAIVLGGSYLGGRAWCDSHPEKFENMKATVKAIPSDVKRAAYTLLSIKEREQPK
jgi:hypothetical protein